MIAIIGAMEEEVANIRNLMEDMREERHAGMTFCFGDIADREVVVVKSGIGKVNMAACAQVLADRFDADVLINTGVAGSLDARINIGDIVIASDAVYHDMDATAFGDAAGQVPRMDVFAFPTDTFLSEKAAQLNERVNPDIRTFRGRVLSGDQFVADAVSKVKMTDMFGGLCCEMEGAAMAHVAYLNHIPCLIIRAISDKADGSAHEDYAAFEHKAIAHMTKLLAELIPAL